MTKAKVVVVGAGPHALALSLLLVGRDEGWRDDLVVIDPSGRWMGAWQGRFAAHCIDRLRSAAVHHPHPDPLLLRAHAADAGRLDELFDPYSATAPPTRKLRLRSRRASPLSRAYFSKRSLARTAVTTGSWAICF